MSMFLKSTLDRESGCDVSLHTQILFWFFKEMKSLAAARIPVLNGEMPFKRLRYHLTPEAESESSLKRIMESKKIDLLIPLSDEGN